MNEADRKKWRVCRHLEDLILRQRWNEFDAQLEDALLPERDVVELLKLKLRALEAEQAKTQQIEIDKIKRCEKVRFDHFKTLIDQRKWAEFDEQLVMAELSAELRQRLRELKIQGVTTERRERLVCELKRLLEEREWREFDTKLLQERILLSSDWDGLLESKAEALQLCVHEEIRPDTAQARILASRAKTLRVTARAGSGKTRLLTALTYFLIDQYKCAPEEILLLAFNKNAALELEKRITKLLQIPAFSGARTFHSLAYGIVQPELDIIYDEGEEVWQSKLTSLVQEILRDLLDAELLDEVYDLFWRETTEARDTGAFLIGEASYDFRRVLKHFTLAGHFVKSRGEKYISDFLFEHELRHYYENPTRWERGVYRPDFKIMTGAKSFVIWEHWAVHPDAEHVPESREWPETKLREYQAEARRKREFWRGKGVPLIETCAGDCADRELFERRIAAKLRPHFPHLRRLPKAQLVEKIIEIHLSKLAKWLGQAIQRAQKLGMDATRLTQALIKHPAATKREELFLALLEKVFVAYAPRLDAEGQTDFDRLFNEAIRLLRENPPNALLRVKHTTIDLRRLRFCLVDEAQDLSPQFMEALACLRELNPAIRLIFVGDDWQAINRFSGSDVKLFTHDITESFGNCATPTLATNYRSVQKVVLAGNRLMKGQGVAAVPHKSITGNIQIAYLDKVWVEGRESEVGWREDAPFREYNNGLEKFFKALYQLAIADLLNGKTVGVLFRTNKRDGQSLKDLEKSFIRLLRRMGWPKEVVHDWQKKQSNEKVKIRFSTAHRFKGEQCDTVFVVDPYAGNFPLLNADSIELFRFFGDNLEQAEADERRLFYVAITRAEERLVFLTETRRDKEDSPYLSAFRDLIDVIEVPNEVIHPLAPQALKTAD
jgi:DNA helicase-4